MIRLRPKTLPIWSSINIFYIFWLPYHIKTVDSWTCRFQLGGGRWSSGSSLQEQHRLRPEWTWSSPSGRPEWFGWPRSLTLEGEHRLHLSVSCYLHVSFYWRQNSAIKALLLLRWKLYRQWKKARGWRRRGGGEEMRMILISTFFLGVLGWDRHIGHGIKKRS